MHHAVGQRIQPLLIVRDKLNTCLWSRLLESTADAVTRNIMASEANALSMVTTLTKDARLSERNAARAVDAAAALLRAVVLREPAFFPKVCCTPTWNMVATSCESDCSWVHIFLCIRCCFRLIWSTQLVDCSV